MRWTPLKLSLLVVLSFSMSLILVSFLFYKNINILLGFWDKEAKITFYLKADATEPDKAKILEALKSDTDLESIQLVDRTAAAVDFKKMFGEYSSGIISVDEMIDLIPESYTAVLKSGLSTDEKDKKLSSLKQTLSAEPFIEEISYGGEWLNKFSKLDRALKIFGFTLSLVLSLTVCFISALMVRSLVDDSKSEIEVFSLLGATRWVIYRKYLQQFLFFFGLSIIVSLALTFAVYYIIKNRFLVNQGFQFIADNIRFLSATESAIPLTILFLFVMLGASLSLRSTIQRLSLFSHD